MRMIMPTKHPRINITLEKQLAALLEEIAEQENVSISSLTKELILEALERREDLALSDIAKIRDTDNAKKVKHKDAWK